jgi:hypothetical protein
MVLQLQASADQYGPWDTLRQTDPANLNVGANSHATVTVEFSGTPIPTQYAYYRVRLDYTWGNCDHAHTLTVVTDAQPVCVSGSATPTAPPLTGTATDTVTDTPTRTSLTATPTIAPSSTSTACTVEFSDVLPGSTFYPYIHCLACLGIVNGYPDGTFKPNANVTRGQLSKIVSNSAGFHDDQTTQMFQDVIVGSTFFQYIGRLASRGYISGYPCSGPGEPCQPGNLPYFRPNTNATRGQISKIDANAAGFSDMPSGQQFEDVPVGSAFYTYTYRLVSRNVMSGYPCGGTGEPCVPPANLPYFRPNNNATRGQTSKIVANTFFPDCQIQEKRDPK